MTYKFPVIRHLDDLMEHISECEYLVASKKENGTTGVSYIYSDKDSFANEWERECRGITFDKDGYIISRTLHKFFNLGEREAYLLKNLDLSKVKAIYPKLDGSMISSCLVDDEVALKSKNSFKSDVALDASAYTKREENKDYIRFCRDMALKGLTPTFEYTSPNNRIVLKYDVECLTLLQVRNNITGEYLDIDEMSAGYKIAVVKTIYDKTKDIKELVKEMETMRDAEGVVVMLESGDMFKMKCFWYCNLHNCVTFVRNRDVARLVCDESLDDFRGQIAIGGYDGIDMDKVDKIEETIFNTIKGYNKKVDELIEELDIDLTKKIDFKSASAKLMNNENCSSEMFVFTMNKLRGKKTNYLEFYRLNHLKNNWDLEVV